MCVHAYNYVCTYRYVTIVTRRPSWSYVVVRLAVKCLSFTMTPMSSLYVHFLQGLGKKLTYRLKLLTQTTQPMRKQYVTLSTFLPLQRISYNNNNNNNMIMPKSLGTKKHISTKGLIDLRVYKQFQLSTD